MHGTKRTRAHGERERCRYWNRSATDWRESLPSFNDDEGRGRVESLEDAGLRNRPVSHAQKIPPVLKTIKLTVPDTPRLSRMEARAPGPD